jgi:hypothetical protein
MEASFGVFGAPVMLAAASLLLSTSVGFAAGLELHGFVQGDYSARVTGLRPPGGSDFILAEERVQLSANGAAQSGRAAFSAKTDLIHDSITDESDLEVREAYLDLSGGPIEARIGRQIVTWGTGDLLFINDVFPKDWVALFAGRPLEYLKVGSDALKVSAYWSGVQLETVVTPFFEPDRLPSGDRFVMRNPFGDGTVTTLREPAARVDDPELAFRAAKTWIGWEWALYAARGFYRTPAPAPFNDPATIELRFPRRHLYGASVQGAHLGGVVHAEAGYYDSRDDAEGDDPFVPNSQALLLAGYKRAIGRSVMTGLQLYGERMVDYDRYRSNLPPGMPEQDRLRTLVTGRFTWLSNYQTWRVSLFGYWSPSDVDYYLIPEVWRSLADGVWVAVGSNVFGGKDSTTFFGQLDRNDNAYAAMRYEF